MQLKGGLFVTLFVLLICCFVSVRAAYSYGTELILNPSFETNDGVTATSWSSFGLGYSLTSTAHSGSAALSITANLTHPAAAYQLVSFNSPYAFEVSAWMRGLGTDSCLLNFPPFTV
jgi:hypothetical protein